MQQKNIGTDKGLQKIKYFCSYQERSHQEVKDKLYSFGLYKYEVEQLLSTLIEENYLNEERYAIAFAGGKFRVKNWGRIKIKYELKQNGVSAYCISAALKAIDEKEYLTTLLKLYDAKKKSLSSEKDIFIKKRKIGNYLLQKGFESSLIQKLFNEG